MKEDWIRHQEPIVVDKTGAWKKIDDVDVSLDVLEAFGLIQLKTPHSKPQIFEGEDIFVKHIPEGQEPRKIVIHTLTRTSRNRRRFQGI